MSNIDTTEAKIEVHYPSDVAKSAGFDVAFTIRSNNPMKPMAHIGQDGVASIALSRQSGEELIGLIRKVLDGK